MYPSGFMWRVKQTIRRLKSNNMPEFRIRKTPKGLLYGKQQYLYEVIDRDGNVYGTRTSPRTYVACAVSVVSPEDYGVLTWFGRYDLIGKGASGRYLKQETVYVARLLDENPWNDNPENLSNE